MLFRWRAWGSVNWRPRETLCCLVVAPVSTLQQMITGGSLVELVDVYSVLRFKSLTEAGFIYITFDQLRPVCITKAVLLRLQKFQYCLALSTTLATTTILVQTNAAYVSYLRSAHSWLIQTIGALLKLFLPGRVLRQSCTLCRRSSGVY